MTLHAPITGKLSMELWTQLNSNGKLSPHILKRSLFLLEISTLYLAASSHQMAK
jgi:hypothetical protein